MRLAIAQSSTSLRLALSLIGLAWTIGTATSAVVPSPVIQREFRYEPGRVRLLDREGRVEVSLRGGLRESTPGRADLPLLVERIDLPAGMRVRQLRVTALETRPLRTSARIGTVGPVPGSRSDDAPSEGADDAVASIGYQGSLRGRSVAWLQVRPIRWDPSGGRLDQVTRLSVRAELEPDPEAGDIVRRERVVAAWEEDATGWGEAAVVGATSPRPGAQPFRPTQLPSVEGSPVAYVIVTSDALAPEFQRLADWKTRSGVPAVVRTLSFIQQEYPDGVDDADRVRRFLRDAYARWGTAWALLGGDTEVLPTRIIWSTLCYQAVCVPPPLNDIATDHYFACLDGNWNADGDQFFGEGAQSSSVRRDKADLLPELWVGRAPVTTVAEAQHFVDRTLAYATTPAGDYEHRTLFFAEMLFPQDWSPGQNITLDGASLAELLLPPLASQPGRHSTRLYENYLGPWFEPGALQLSRARVIDSLNTGYNVAVHVGHGFRNVASCGDANFTNADALALTNGSRVTNTYMSNCTSNAIDFPCLGEAMMLAPNGGSVTNIGSSRLDFPSIGSFFQEEYFRLVFEQDITAVGEAQAKQKLPFVGPSDFDNTYRWSTMTLLLLGDPELRIWTRPPSTLAVSHPATVTADVAQFAVHVESGGAPLAGARVTLLKAGDEYRIGLTDGSGNATLTFQPDDVGSLLVTVTALNARPYQATVPVTAAGPPVLGDLAITLDDDAMGGTSGNANQIPEAGEVLDLSIPVRNQGGQDATGVIGTLTTADPLVTIDDPTHVYGTIAIGATAPGSGGFRISTPYDATDQHECALTLTLVDGAARTWVESLRLTLRAGEPRHVGHAVTELAGNGDKRPDVGETVDYTPILRNQGTGHLAGVTAVLRALDGLSAVTDSTAGFPPLAPGAEVSAGDPFRFTVLGAGARFELRIAGAQGMLHTQRLDLTWPGVPAGLSARGSSGSIQLTWTPSPETDLAGYRVSRATAPGGPYVLANPTFSDRTSYFQDAGLAPLTTYYFTVSAVDSSGNASFASAPVAASTNPPYHPIFPIDLGISGGNSPASVAVTRIYQPGTQDILAGADVLYVWHADGTAPVDADQSSATSGDFTAFGDYYAGGPSVADIDGGGLEILGATWNSQEVFAFDQQGQPKPGWPFVAPYPIFSCLAVGDLDNDGTKEIVFGANGPAIFVLRADGNEWMDGDANPMTTGVFRTLGGTYNYGTPAIADLDLDGQRDIIYASFDGLLHAWRPDGSYLSGFPVSLGGGVTSSVAIGRLDGPTDTTLEIVVACGAGDDSLYVFDAAGGRRPGFPIRLMSSGVFGKSPSPALADIDGDSYLDIVAAGTDGRLVVVDRDGIDLPTFVSTRYSLYTESASESSPVVADINGDGGPDIVIGDEDATLSAIGPNGTLLPGFPIRIGGEIKGTPALCDCDGDGMTEIVLVGWDGKVYVWDYDFAFSPSGVAPWPQFHHDAMRTGLASAETVVAAPQRPAPLRVDLAAPVPNPARLASRISWSVPVSQTHAATRLDLFDLSGRRVRRLFDGRSVSGVQSVLWDLADEDRRRVAAGVYLVRLQVGEDLRTARLVLMP